MRRRIFTLASFISLLSCLLTVGLWVREKYFLEDELQLVCRSHVGNDYLYRNLQIWSGFGRVAIVWHVTGSADRSFASYYFSVEEADVGRLIWSSHPMSNNGDQGGNVWERLNLLYRSGSFNGGTGPSGTPVWYTEVRFPQWLLILCLAIAPSLWVESHIRSRKRRDKCLCPTCSYDLTGNTSGTCPECGSPVPQASRPA